MCDNTCQSRPCGQQAVLRSRLQQDKPLSGVSSHSALINMSAHHVHTPIPCRWTLVISFVNELVRSRGDVFGCTNLRRRKHFDTCQEDLAWSQGSRSSSILHRFVDYGHDLRVVDSHTLEHSTLRNRALTSTTLSHKGRHNTQVHVYVRAHLYAVW